ncbi:sulfotransferase [Sphingomonas sp. AOB5]|uniref:sulfotransferase n=1 Tax=Sphingomonas sp. AOB5 TaxID=3034017 RepID=UPI0023F878A4|nr:sulfotransferase [Sphingomonas sp. AOB5]MDF7775096.1 sulfotransferase [Sphingomonas sp. AOB5]
MYLTEPLLRLPIRFDADALKAEMDALPPRAWVAHPNRLPGNEAVRLVTPDGAASEGTEGNMAPTEFLRASPYMMQVMAEIGAVWGRGRLMRLAPGATVPPHIDTNFYWRKHLRIHVPIVTSPQVAFTCNGRTVNMAAGECWAFDTFSVHQVRNDWDQQRTHLVIDTVGSDGLWDLIARARRGENEAPRLAAPDKAKMAAPRLAFEQADPVAMMSPWELRHHVGFIETLAQPDPELPALLALLDRFVWGWTGAWSAYGPQASGSGEYNRLLSHLEGELRRFPLDRMRLRNTQALGRHLAELIFNIREKLDRLGQGQPAAPARIQPKRIQDHFKRPLFIVSSPRSGSTLLFLTLAKAAGVHTVGGESHGLIEMIPGLHPRDRSWSSNRLTAEDATPELSEELASRFYSGLHDRDGKPPAGAVTMIEKTPKNSLRVPFMHAIFPDARFLYLYRDPRQTLSSMLEAWGTGKFLTYPNLPQWPGPVWSLLLVPGWKELRGKPLAEIVARQWAETTSILLDDLEALPREQVCAVAYDTLLAAPQETIESLCRQLDLDWDLELGATLPISPTTVSAPHPDKWRRHEAEIERVWPIIEPVEARARAALARFSV